MDLNNRGDKTLIEIDTDKKYSVTVTLRNRESIERKKYQPLPLLGFCMGLWLIQCAIMGPVWFLGFLAVFFVTALFCTWYNDKMVDIELKEFDESVNGTRKLRNMTNDFVNCKFEE